MENKQYRPRRGPMGRSMRGGEKPKDLVGIWKKLLGYCKKYTAFFIIAVICASVGTVCTLVGPDKLSDMTDEITSGIKPDTDELEKITTAVSDNISDNMQKVLGKIAANMSDPQNMKPEIKINGSDISLEDQKEALKLIRGMNKNNSDAAQNIINKLPQSVRAALYTDIAVDGVTITAQDQSDMLAVMADIDAKAQESRLKAFDKLPDSVHGLVKPSINMDKIIMSTITQKVSRQMRSDISYKINRLPMSFYNKTTTGDVLSRVTNDVDTIGQSLNQSIGTLITAVILFVGSLFMMIKTDIWMTLTAVCTSLIGFAIMFTIMGRSQKYFRRQQKNLGEINGHIEEIYTGHTVVKAYNGEERAQSKFDVLNEKLMHSGFMAQCLSGMMMPIMNFIGNLGYVAVCVVGGAMALDGRISFGVIVAFMMYVRYFTQPLSQMAQAVQSMQSAGAAGERVFEFLGAEEMENEDGKLEKLEPVKGGVTFEHVKFGYDDSDRIVIHDFSAKAKPGQKIAIVGPTGAGKSTLVNLLMRFYEIQGGKIMIDGVPTNQIKRETVHSQFCMVLQDTWLFEGTVRENLVYCTQNVSEEKMKQACKAVGLDHFIRTLPKGYDTILNDQVNLSQGQKQQLTIARAMIADKPMLILDEATSSVDTRTEQQIQAAMDKLMENRTSFVIAHRLSTIKNADLILVLKDGDIIESGNHEDLMKQNGFYASLYNSQFERVS